ncbi:Aldo/keto reductase [Atractiella rhizophila]|nr:Aldo/keto reductase [Atractiella rhizophila]
MQSTTLLNSGYSLPLLGYGFYKSSECTAALEALRIGYRLLDGSRFDENEELMGVAISQSGKPREEVFCISKTMAGFPETSLSSADYVGSSNTALAVLEAVKDSVVRSTLGYFDLFLLHDPCAGEQGRIDAWKGLEMAVEKRYCRSIGVSNFGVAHLEQLLTSKPKIRPAVNQIEVHPWCQQREIRAFCEKENIIVQSYCCLARGKLMDDPTLLQISSKHSKTPAQILIRWCLQQGIPVVPKSAVASRMRENTEVFDFELSQEDMGVLDGLDQGSRGATSWNPIDVT